MDSEILAQLKGRLVDGCDKIVAQLETVTKEKSFNKDKVQTKWQDLGNKDEDNAVEVADYQDNISLERNLETSLEKIKIALQKIEAGTYGICEKCGRPIEEARLSAYPEAADCVACTNK
jgi:DnaK suppressor protein